MNELYDGVSACMSDPYSVFSYLSPERVRDLCAFIECKSFVAGDVIWNEGDPCDYVAFVASGSVEVKKETEFKGKHVIVGIYKRGAIVGALCILDGGTRAVAAVALEDVMLATITRENFDRLISTNPELGAHLMKGMLLSLSKRLRKSFERLATFF